MSGHYEDVVKPFIEEQVRVLRGQDIDVREPGRNAAFLTFAYPKPEDSLMRALIILTTYRPGVAYTLTTSTVVGKGAQLTEVVISYDGLFSSPP